MAQSRIKPGCSNLFGDAPDAPSAAAATGATGAFAEATAGGDGASARRTTCACAPIWWPPPGGDKPVTCTIGMPASMAAARGKDEARRLAAELCRTRPGPAVTSELPRTTTVVPRVVVRGVPGGVSTTITAAVFEGDPENEKPTGEQGEKAFIGLLPDIARGGGAHATRQPWPLTSTEGDTGVLPTACMQR